MTTPRTKSEWAEHHEAVRVASGVIQAVAEWLYWNTDEPADQMHPFCDIYWTTKAMKLVSPDVRKTYQGVERR